MMHTLRVAIVEDDPFQASTLREHFCTNGANVQTFQRGQQFLARIGHEHFDLATLDLGLPDMPGLMLLDELRQQGRWMRSAIPVVVVSGSTQAQLMQSAFERGAMDYLIKPYKPDELTVRARSAVQRFQSSLFDSPRIHIGPMTLDSGSMQCLINGHDAMLSPKEFSLAWVLCESPGRVVLRDELLRRVWRHAGKISSRTLDTHICRLRQKLTVGTNSKTNVATNLGPNIGPIRRIRVKSVYSTGYRIDLFP